MTLLIIAHSSIFLSINTNNHLLDSILVHLLILDMFMLHIFSYIHLITQYYGVLLHNTWKSVFHRSRHNASHHIIDYGT